MRQLWRHFVAHVVLAHELVTQARVLHIPDQKPLIMSESFHPGAFKLRTQVPELRRDLRAFMALIGSLVSLALYAWLALTLFVVSLLSGILLLS